MACIIGSGGTLIRDLQRSLEVKLDWIHQKNESGSGSGSSQPKKQLEELIIKGTSTKVALAQSTINSLIVKYMSETIMLTVPEAVVPSVVGKGGSVLKQIRSDFPNVTIEVEDNIISSSGSSANANANGEGSSTVTIHSSDYTSREGARLAIEKVVDNNYMETIKFNNITMIALKGKQGQECRNELNLLNLNCDMKSEDETITLRGEPEKVRKGLFLLSNFSFA